MQGRGGHSSPELGDTCRHRETNVKDCKRHAAESWETHGIQGLHGRGGHSGPELKTHVKDCKREADIAAQSWETIVLHKWIGKREAMTNKKRYEKVDKRKQKRHSDQQEGRQDPRQRETADTMTSKKRDKK